MCLSGTRGPYLSLHKGRDTLSLSPCRWSLATHLCGYQGLSLCRWDRVAEIAEAHEIAESLAKKFQNSFVRGSDKGRSYPVLYNMLWKYYKNEKMSLNAREKIGLKLFSTKQILLRKSTFLCVNWIDFSLSTVESLRDKRKNRFSEIKFS